MLENQKASKKLSVAIPTYNRLNYLKDCIKSILNQTFQDFSIFVFDNASSEPIEEELKKFNDKRIKFIGNDKNIGPAGNINRALHYPFESEYLVVFHSDDLMHPKMLKLQTSFLDKNNNIVFAASDFKGLYDRNIFKFQDFAEDKIEYIIYKNNYEFSKAMMSWLRCAFSSVMYRVKFIGDSKMEHDKFSDFADQIFFMEISKKGPSAFIKAPLMNYRLHPDQDSKQLKGGYEEGAIKTLSFFRENLPPVLNKKDKKLFNKYSLNFLIRTYANINKGFSDFLRFIKKCRRQKLVRYRNIQYIDLRGIVSLASIIFRNKKILSAAGSFRDFFEKK